MSQFEHQVPKRYAQALFNAAKAQNKVDEISEELTAIRNAISTDDSLIDFLTAPQVTDEAKFELIDSVFKGQFSELVYSFIKLTVDKRRAQYIRSIIETYTFLVEEEKGILRARVTTAVPLELDLRDKLRKKLESITGKEIRIYPDVDKNIIGGVIINMNNRVVDDSVRDKLATIKEDLMSIKIHKIE